MANGPLARSLEWAVAVAGAGMQSEMDSECTHGTCSSFLGREGREGRKEGGKFVSPFGEWTKRSQLARSSAVPFFASSLFHVVKPE